MLLEAKGWSTACVVANVMCVVAFFGSRYLTELLHVVGDMLVLIKV